MNEQTGPINSISHSMAHSQFWDEEDNLQIRKVLTTIMNNRSKSADKGSTSGLGSGRVSKNFTTPETNMIKMFLGPW